jgi:hypothetical protein
MLQDMGMGGQVYDRNQIEQMYGKGGEDFPGQQMFVCKCQAARLLVK